MIQMFEEPPLPILLYHKCPPNLREQFEAIRDLGYRPVHLAEVKGYFEKPSELPQDLIVITFDDALQDFYKIAIPLLEQFCFPATICVPTGRISDDPLHRRIDNWKNNEHSANPLMTWDELKYLQQLRTSDGKTLIEFASHSVRHTNLNDFESNEKVLQYEFVCSKLALQNLLDLDGPIFFSFPYGAGEGKLTKCLRDAGYAGALMVKGDKWGQFRIPRHEPEDNDSVKLRLWLSEQKKIARSFNAG